jgi:hypothetical protein
LAPRRKATTPARIKLAEKESQALELRKGGATYARIAQVLGYTEEGGAAKAVKRALKDTLQEPADEMRRLEAQRLDAMQSALWPAAISGKWLAVDRCLGIMERRARMLGLDMPANAGNGATLVNINLITDSDHRSKAADLRRGLAAHRTIEPGRLGAGNGPDVDAAAAR